MSCRSSVSSGTPAERCSRAEGGRGGDDALESPRGKQERRPKKKGGITSRALVIMCHNSCMHR